jgi:hypothetical protein
MSAMMNNLGRRAWRRRELNPRPVLIVSMEIVDHL